MKLESFDVEAVGYAEFEEVADEGACWAFDLGDGRVVILVGQQFYPSARFPSLDFSVVYPLDEDGAPADMWIERRGEAVPPDSGPLRMRNSGLIPAPGEVAYSSSRSIDLGHGRPYRSLSVGLSDV